jgi:predicted metal-dependent HD superfamily phosphohydrolase
LYIVKFAAWFHDIVYDSQAKDNEEKSAAYGAEVLKSLGIPLHDITEINRLILCTKNHQAGENDLNSQVLLDADLAILAVNPVEYQAYTMAIRREYSWVSESDYIIGRRQVLEKFLQRQRLYFTPLLFEISEKAARENLKTEIKFLQQKMP